MHPTAHSVPLHDAPDAPERAFQRAAAAPRRHAHAAIRFEDFQLASHFQPIYSLPHARLVGHEALLRASRYDGTPVPPPVVFASCADAAALSDCDRLCRLAHLDNFARQRDAGSGRPDPEWLFLNVHPLAFQRLAEEGGAAQLQQLQQSHGLPARSVVLEVLEAESADPRRLAESIAVAREAGILIAIDDFGAGHSNFDRVWRMRPDIVKIDRSLVAHAAQDTSARRILAQMVMLLHECGSMVLIEGVETEAEAMVAIECDAEMVQGYLFARPQAPLHAPRHAPSTLLGLPARLASLRSEARGRVVVRQQPYQLAMAELATRLSLEAGQPPGGADAAAIEHAAHCDESVRSQFARLCQGFLSLPGAEACYLLDADGLQISDLVTAPHTAFSAPPGAGPMADSTGACWAQRPYFRKALAVPGEPQVSRPYRTLSGQHLCATVSIAFTMRVNHRPTLRVACGDFLWEE